MYKIMKAKETFVVNLRDMIYKNLIEKSDTIKMSASVDNYVHNTYLTSIHTFTPELDAILQPALDEIAKSDLFVNAVKEVAGRNITEPALYSSFVEGDIYDINLVFGTQED